VEVPVAPSKINKLKIILFAGLFFRFGLDLMAELILYKKRKKYPERR